MKTKEFIREIEKLGYKVQEQYSWFYVVKSLNGSILGYVEKGKQYRCDTMQSITDEQVSKLIFEYAMTPVEEREEEVNCMQAMQERGVIMVNNEVKNPNHYKLDGLDVESIDVVRAVLGDEGFINFCLGNILKYAIRCKKKGQFKTDIEKIGVYASFIKKIG